MAENDGPSIEELAAAMGVAVDQYLDYINRAAPEPRNEGEQGGGQQE
jgi:hypothetical protein